MTQTALHSPPRAGDVLREQLRAVGLALRVPGVAATALAGLATLVILTQGPGSVEPAGFRPEHQMLPGIVGLLLPIAVWKGEERFGAGFLWTLPVERRRHALLKVGAGWVWLMASVTLFLLWLLALTLLSGGGVMAEETIRVLSSPLSSRGAVDAAELRSVLWTPRPVLWLVPFTAATGAYLLSSALALGVRHPLRWIVGALLGTFLVFAVGDATRLEWLESAPVRILDALFAGPYGFDALLTARTESLKIEATLSSGERVLVWRAVPDLAQWAVATLLWTAAGLVGLWAAASRHREGRRP